MPIKDFTSQKDLSYHLDAIPMIPAKPGDGFDLLTVSYIDTNKKYESLGDCFLPASVGYLKREYISSHDHPMVEHIESLESKVLPDFVAAADKVFNIGLSASGPGEVVGAEIEVEANFGKVSKSGIVLIDCKKDDCSGVPGLIDFLKRNAETLCQAPMLQERLYCDPESHPNSHRVLLAVVVQTIHGLEKTAVVKDSSVEGKVKVVLPKIATGAAGASVSQQQAETASQRGVIGIVVAILHLEIVAVNKTIKVWPKVPFVQRVDDERFEKAVSWKKMPRFLQRFEHKRSGSFSFVLGDTIELETCNTSDSFYSARQDARERAPNTVIDEGSSGHAILRGEPLYSPSRVFRGSDIHYQGRMNFLYQGEASELEDVCEKLIRGESVQIREHQVTSVTPAVPFDDGDYVSIHYTIKGNEDPNDLPGALLRYEGDVKVLVPIDPLGNAVNSKEAVTISTSGWEVQESIMYVGLNDSYQKKKLEHAGFQQLAGSEARVEDVPPELKNEEYVVMGRHELVNLASASGEVFGEDFAR